MTDKQRGGTLLGLIIGGLVGLGVALAVAVYITKMPVPFNSKSLSSGADSDAAETMKNKDWDPNATLAGKNPAKPRALAASEASGADPAALAASAAAAPASAPKVAQPAAGAASSSRASSGDPLGDLARAVTAPGTPAKARPAPADPIGDLARSVTARPALPAVPARSQSGDSPGDLGSPAAIPALPAAKARPAELMPATQASDPFHYFVQAGAFRTEEEASKHRARLQSLGIQAQVSEREQAGRTVYRVRLGPFDRKDEAEKMTDKLGDNSIDATLVRVQR